MQTFLPREDTQASDDRAGGLNAFVGPCTGLSRSGRRSQLSMEELSLRAGDVQLKFGNTILDTGRLSLAKKIACCI